MVTFTFYDSIYHTRGGVVRSFAWSEAQKLFLEHDVRGTEEDLEAGKVGPAVVLGEMDPSQPRKQTHMKEVWAIGLDFDGCPEDILERALDALQPLTHVAYTTHKSGAKAVGGLIRLRVIVPLVKPVPPRRYVPLWAYLSRLTGWLPDSNAKDPSRLHYLPSTFDKAHAKAYSHEATTLDPHGITDEALRAFEEVDKARKGLKYLRGDLKEAAMSLLAGEPFATQGDRHTTQRGLTMRLAQKTKDNPLTDAAVEVLFARSIALMQASDPTSPGLKAVVTAYRGALELLQGEVNEAQLQGQDPYTASEMPVPEDSKLWLVQKGSGYYFATPTGYHGPYVKDEFGPAARDHLARAPISLIEVRSNGTTRQKTPGEIMIGHGTVAERVIVDLTTNESTYDPRTGTFREAPLAVNPYLKPQYHPQVDEWLHVFAGPQAETLLDWLACAPHLDRMLCALYLKGVPGCGKGILAEALANIWSGTCVDIEALLSSFNEELTRCPVVLGDEELPSVFKGKAISAKLRTELGRTVRELHRKYLAPTEIHGNIRLVLAANRDDLLKSTKALTREDASAIAQRFLYVPAADESEHYLLGLDYDERTLWKTTKIPEHILHLSQTRRVEPHGRFWVQGSVSTMTDLLMTGSDWNSRVCEWLVAYLTRPEPVDAKPDAYLIHDDDGLFVNVRAITEGWAVYFPNTKVEADTRAIADALRSIAGKRIRKRVAGKQLQYFEVDLELLWAWAERNGVGDVAQMKGKTE